MTKKELFEYLKTVKDKSGGLKKKESIKKNYPELYAEMEKIKFPDNYSFTQKLWHFLQDDFSIHKCKCGNNLHFIDFKKGYRTYCSTSCPCVVEYNKTTLKLAQESSRKEESRKKAVDTILKKNNGKFWSDENMKRLKQPYKDNIERCNKIRNAMIKNRPLMSKKIHEKIKSNIEIFNSISGKSTEKILSSIEIGFYKYLIYLFGFDNVDPQHYDTEKYPYSCDFYIYSINLYIEIQGTWTHGKHPYDETNIYDQKKVNFWKSKNNEYYNNAIYTWTNLDVRKRKIPKENKLNYLEIFSNKLDDCVDLFENYIKDLLVDWCFKNELPGNTKWPNNHPIWDCNVGELPSPRCAWNNREYLKKAVDNMFKMMKDDEFRVKHINEILKCKIENNEIVESSELLLRMILNRFTVAKIAPKVTALKSNILKNIIDESGIDISNGVYIPMAGFGGIVEGVKLWGDEHNKSIDCECYDINPFFCKWYGWKQRNMLEKKIKTDKICICCPPFGKDFEHWNGTPNDMSNIDFKEWYKLIKEYVDAPTYIIIGPEINKNKSTCGLFSKKIGVMLWTDDMIK